MNKPFPHRPTAPHITPVLSKLRTLLLILLVAWVALGLKPAAAEHRSSQPRTLVGQLKLMAAEQDFELSGLDKIDPTAAPGEPDPNDETTTQHIRSLLRGYDHVIVHASKKRIGRLLILGKKGSAPAPAPAPEDGQQQAAGGEIVLPTRRLGEHHVVSANLQGPAGEALQVELMVDTGASLVVLPNSNAAPLGLKLDELERQELQTAKGKLEAGIGQISAIQLGDARVENIEVAFVEDELLGAKALLGMNVLGRYLFILDDDNNQLTLIQEGK